MRLIDADVIIRDLTAMKSLYDAIELDGMIKALKKAPTIKAAPVVHGEWIEKPYLLGTTRYCSICQQNYGMPHGVFNFCPNCGAKMDGKAVN